MTYTKDELETHVWYDPNENKTYIETNVKRHITKVMKSNWTIVDTKYHDTIPDYVTYVRAFCNGFGISIRNRQN